MITPNMLRAVGASMPDAQLYAPLLEKFRVVEGDSYNTISSKAGRAMLISQLAHESGHFRTTEESLTYSVEALKGLKNGKGLRYFTNPEAEEFGYIRNRDGSWKQRANPVMIANLYYGGRMGNRGVDTNDGYAFRGAGLIQLTGRYNHENFGASVGMTAEESAVYCKTPEGAARSALWFWRENGLLIPASRGDVTECTRIINGGVNGLQARVALYRAAFDAIG